MNELKKKQKQIKATLKNDYHVNVSKRWFDRYLFLFSKCTPLKKITMGEAVDIIIEDPALFAYFIYGQRAEYVNNKMMEKAKAFRESNEGSTESEQETNTEESEEISHP